MNSQWDGCVSSQRNTLYVNLQKTYGQQTKQGAELHREARIFKTTWTFDRVTNVTIWKSYLFIIKRVMARKTCLGLYLCEGVQNVNA